jgi:hypothetical protein
MPIISTDLVTRLTTTAGAAGDSTASTPAASLGKYASTTVFATGLNGLFDNISGAENAASTADYRGIYILNNHATLTALGCTVYLDSEVAGGASIAIGVDPGAISVKTAASAQGVTIASETTAPAGVTFTSPTTLAGGILLGDIPAGSGRVLWVRRTAANNAALDADGVTLGIGCDTAA